MFGSFSPSLKDDINIAQAPFKFKDLDYLLDGLLCSVEIVDLERIEA